MPASLQRQATVTPPIAPQQQPAPSPPTISFEERLGTQWTVWVGGIALAFGGFFLVRYSIEQGYFGPGMRVFLGALLAAGLIAAGEWARRSEKLSGITGLPSAHIPSILTAAGTAVAYADVYAAYALYGFLGAGDARGGARPWTRAGRSWARRRLRHAIDCQLGAAELLGALHLSRGRHGRRLRAGARACGRGLP
jgi:hypothetical protein